jgi:hypothetical protein
VGWAPIFSVVRPGKHEVTSWKLSWQQEAVHRPFFQHALAVGGVAMAMLAAGDLNPRLTAMYQRVYMEQNDLALQCLRKDLARADFMPSVYHVQTAAWLIPKAPETARSTCEPYPLSPLQHLQNLQGFAAFDLTMFHVNAMYYMCNIIGGLESFKLNAMADILQVYVNSR